MEGPAKLAQNAGGSSSSGGTPLEAAGDLAGSAAKPRQSGSGLGKAPIGARRDLLNTIIGRPGHVKPSGSPPQHYSPPDGEQSNGGNPSTGGSAQYQGAN